ncbi:MAG: hypothetical protein CMJ58_21380 [Planctomycetaceae bacterium]|nr:hypothetical protein [Planctomycetaceae bacterium]
MPRMLRIVLCHVGLLVALLATTATSAKGPQEVLLYPADHAANVSDAPVQSGTPEWMERVVARPAIIPFLPDDDEAADGEKPRRPACLICPGGGYGGLAMQKEGVEPAEWLNKHGVAGFVLRYRCGGGENQQPVPLDDARRAMRMIRMRADQWGVDPERVGVWGFSAGGHLASTLAVFGRDAHPNPGEAINGFSERPDFAVLVYPVISMVHGVTHGGSRHNLLGPDASDELAAHWSTDQQVTAETPPTFLVHATDDGGVPVSNATLFYTALVKHGVPAELHIFQAGGHGFGMYRGDRPADRWPDLLEPWLRGQGVVK